MFTTCSNVSFDSEAVYVCAAGEGVEEIALMKELSRQTQEGEEKEMRPST